MQRLLIINTMVNFLWGDVSVGENMPQTLNRFQLTRCRSI